MKPISKSLRGKRALITGATSGIGWNIARLLAQRGVDLVLTCRDAGLLEKKRGEIVDGFKIDCRTVPADLSSEDGVESLIESIHDIDVLVNSAGTISYGQFWELPWDNEKRQVHLLAVAPIRIAHALLPGMLERRFGRILNVASVAGLMPGPYFATYQSAKAFLITFSESLAEELSGTPVTCGCLLPGTTRTDFWNVDRLRDKVDTSEGRFVSPETVAKIAVRMIETGKTFEIVGIANKVKQFILRRFVPRTTVRKMLADHCFSELVLSPKTKPADYTKGASEFMVRRVGKDDFTTFLGAADYLPGGMCPYLAHSIIPYILTLSGGGKFPWMESDDPGAVDAQCPNPGGAVVVRVKRNDGDFLVEVRSVRGHCPKGYQRGQSFEWRADRNIPLPDLNLLLEWLTLMLSNPDTERSPELRSTLGKSTFTIERESGGTDALAKNPCPPKSDFNINLSFCSHRCRYHKLPRRDNYDQSNWIPDGLCAELFHAAYPACLAMLYGGGREAPSEIICPHSGKVRLGIEVEDQPSIKLREAAMKGLRLLKINSEIPLHKCFLHVLEAEDDCPSGMKAGMKFEFNMGGLPSICPAMFHNVYPAMSARMRGAPFPWPELSGARGVIQCPDNISNITMSFREKGQT